MNNTFCFFSKRSAGLPAKEKQGRSPAKGLGIAQKDFACERIIWKRNFQNNPSKLYATAWHCQADAAIGHQLLANVVDR